MPDSIARRMLWLVPLKTPSTRAIRLPARSRRPRLIVGSAPPTHALNRRHGDRETCRRGDDPSAISLSPCHPPGGGLLVSLSPCPLVSLSPARSLMAASSS